jgi:threonine dehydratase
VDIPSFDDVRRASELLSGVAHRTPVLTSRLLDRLTGATLFFKCENFQRAGAFKFRGAWHAVSRLGEAAVRRGVATHSSGNHAAALALAAALRGVPAHVVMPEDAPAVKVAAVKEYGGRITFCAPTLAAREETLAGVLRRTGAVFIHPYDHPHVIAGQGTAALELLEEVPAPDIVLAPVGGGGLLSGTALAVKAVAPATRVVGAEPAGADDAARSLRAGRLIPSVGPVTIADGLLTSLSERTFAIIRRHADDILTAGEESIRRAMQLIMQRMKIVVEPSAAVPLAVVLDHPELFRGKKVAVILSGGNLDPDRSYT